MIIWQPQCTNVATVCRHGQCAAHLAQLTVPGHICREKEGAEAKEGDPWASREFHIKWKRYAFIHTSWETRETLSKLGGYKRITNYIKRQEKEKARPALACLT